MTKIFIDCNIILDWLLEREPFFEFAKELIYKIEKKEYTAYISPLVLSNLYYVLKKSFNKKLAYEFIKDLSQIFLISEMPNSIVLKAIENNYIDFEDDIHLYTALHNKVDYLITRNSKDFLNDKGIIKISAQDFLVREK